MTDIPAPPLAGVRKPSPRRVLSQDAVVTAALHIVDTEGTEALTMRRVAQELSTGPASLYAHVSGRDELLRLAMDRALAGLRLPEPDPARWAEQLKELMRDALAVMRAHGDLARIFQEIGVPLGGNLVRCTEAMLAIMTAGGLSARDRAYAVDALALYVTSFAAEQASRAVGDASDGVFQEIRAYYEELPPDRFPAIAAVREEMVRDVGEERFEFGLDLLITGLAARVPTTG